VVLGGLFGGNGSPDSGVEGTGVQRFSLVSVGGQRITIDDHKRSLRMQDRTGNFLELSPDTVILHAERQMIFDAPGQAVVIRGQTVDFEQK
jgi:hypothetical protein